MSGFIRGLNMGYSVKRSQAAKRSPVQVTVRKVFKPPLSGPIHKPPLTPQQRRMILWRT